MIHAVYGFVRARRPALAAACAVLIALTVATQTHGTVPKAWKALGIPANDPTFSDTWIVTDSMDCMLAGQDPYTTRSFDPWKRLYNYPPIWLEFRHIGITSHTSNLIGILLALIAVAAAVTLFPSSGWIAGAVTFLALWSWPLLFAIERGNIDLLIFAACVFGFLFTEHRHQGVERALLIVALTVLKIYPVAMVTTFLRSSKGWLRAIGVAAVSLVALLATCGRRLPMVLHNTPKDTWESFGSFVTLDLILRHLPMVAIHANLRHAGSVLSLVMGALALTYGLMTQSAGRLLPRVDTRTRLGAVAIAGLSVYCFAYVLGSNYAYRLIFLLLPLAYLVRDMSETNWRHSLPLALLLLGFQFSFYLNLPDLPRVIDPFVFLIACAWLGTSLFTKGVSGCVNAEPPALAR